MESITLAAAPDTTAFAAVDATVFTADPTNEDAAPATAGTAALAALALAAAKNSMTIVDVFVYECACVWVTRKLQCQ